MSHVTFLQVYDTRPMARLRMDSFRSYEPKTLVPIASFIISTEPQEFEKEATAIFAEEIG